MSRKWLLVGSVVLVVGLAGLTLLSYSHPASTVQTTVTSLPTAVVQITADGFIPQTIKIQPGQTIEWRNTTAETHQIASDPYPQHTGNSELGGGKPIKPGQTYTIKLTRLGTFGYHDQLDPLHLKGTLNISPK